MSGTQGTKSWKRLSGELQAAQDRDFERAILIPARAIWPNLVQPEAKAKYDQAGVDLVAFEDGGGIEVAIQCKGFFKAEGVQDDQFVQFKKSIDSFSRSDLTADTYVVVHNQDGRNVGVAARIDIELAHLVKEGKARKVIQWDRESFLKALEQSLRNTVLERVGEQSAAMLANLEAQFVFGRSYVPDVPVAQGQLTLRRASPPLIQLTSNDGQRANIAEVLRQAKGRWTLLTGLFGSGKTTAALHAARLSPKQILYVHAARIEPKFGEGGTNSVMRRILGALDVFGDFPGDERGLFERLAGPMLRQLLQATDTQSLLIIDALDESRTLVSPEAIERFVSALSELSCPLILTTRQEHFRATFGNFDHLFDELSTKGGNMRDVTLLELEPWGHRETLKLVQGALDEAPNNAGLMRLRDDLCSGSNSGWDEEFLHHPLFLRMILDLVGEAAQPLGSSCEIIDAWIWAKLVRDLKASRQLAYEVTDRNRFIEQMEAVMTAAAGAMIVRDAEGPRLLDTIPSNSVIGLVEQTLGVKGLGLGPAIAVSLLIPTTVRHRGDVPVRFTHRAFQEYFLARYLLETGEPPELFPTAVQDFWREMKKNSDF